jgi:hypothetical protein
MTRVSLVGLSSASLLLLCAGCATLSARPDIPIGEWSGNGRFVCAHQVPAQGTDSAGLKTSAASYPTHLKIEQAPGADKDARRLEILSQRGKHECMEGDRTHLIAILEPTVRNADSRFTIYRLVELGVSFDESPPKLEKGPEGQAHASCMLIDGQCVLQIHYMETFVDTFRFHGNVLCKDGSYLPKLDEGFVHWSERLRRQR